MTRLVGATVYFGDKSDSKGRAGMQVVWIAIKYIGIALVQVCQRRKKHFFSKKKKTLLSLWWEIRKNIDYDNYVLQMSIK